MLKRNRFKLIAASIICVLLAVAAAAASAPRGLARATACESTPYFAINPVQGEDTVTCPDVVQVCLDAASQFSGYSQVSGSCRTSAAPTNTSGSNPYYAFSNRVSCTSGVVYRPKWGQGSTWTYGAERSFC
jgi:hypothetical protein